LKLELFIFDTIPMAENVTLVEVVRDEEFSPVKNAPGSATDSPETACRAVLALHKR
jgi:UDP-N-acetylglucosamine/UDP-N-acetylgalactosamine diphosphorylase